MAAHQQAQAPLESNSEQAMVPATAAQLGGPPTDMLEYFSQRGSRAKELEAEISRLLATNEDLSFKLAAAHRDALTAKGEAARMTAQAEARASYEEQDKKRLEAALSKEVAQSTSLHKQLRQAREAQAAAQERAEAAVAAQAGTEAKASQNGSDLALQVQQLREELALVQEHAEDTQRSLEGQLLHQQSVVEATQATIQELGRQLEAATAAEEAAQAAKRDLEKLCSQQQRSLEQVRQQGRQQGEGGAAAGEEGVVVRMLRQALRAQDAQIAEARKLKQNVSNVTLLREQLEAAERRAERAEQGLLEHAQLQGRVQALRQEANHWKTFFKGATDAETPEEVLAKVAALQQEALAAAEKAAAAEAALQAATGAQAEARRAQAQAEAGLEAATSASADAAAALARQERAAALLAKERDGLKRLLASYEEEDLAAQPGQAASVRDQLQAARMAELEAATEALRAQVAALEEELARKAAAEQRHWAQANAAEERAAALEKEAQDLGAQVAALQERLGRGEFNPEASRVLHYVRNPEAEAQEEARQAALAELRAENEALRRQLQRLEAAAGGASAAGGGDAPAGMGAALLEAEITILKRKVAELGRRELRLKEVFKAQITAFREACYFIFGYRVDMASEATPVAAGTGTPPTTFALTPAHADTPRDQLLFKLSRAGDMRLLPNEFTSRKLKREVETFINRFGSIPAFTANLTMENFQKQTQS